MVCAHTWLHFEAPDINGMAVLRACEQIKQRLQPLREKHPEWSFKELAHHAHLERINLSAQGHYATPDITGFVNKAKHSRPFNYYKYGCVCIWLM